VFGTSLDFWLNVQRRTDLWEAKRGIHRVDANESNARDL
jgi:plasmid maintenance system antidote protein VapI